MPQVPSQVLNNLGINLSAPVSDAPSYGMEEQYVRRREDEYNRDGYEMNSYGGGQTMYGENSRQFDDNSYDESYEDDSYDDDGYENPNEFAPNPNRYDREYHRNIKMSDMGFSPDIIGDSELIDYDNPYSNNSFEDREIIGGGGMSEFWDLKNQIGDLRPNDSNYNPFGLVGGRVEMASGEDLFGFNSVTKSRYKGADYNELFGFGGGSKIASASADDLFGFSGVNAKGTMGGNNFDPQTMFGFFGRKKKDEEKTAEVVETQSAKSETLQTSGNVFDRKTSSNVGNVPMPPSPQNTDSAGNDAQTNPTKYGRLEDIISNDDDAFDSPTKKQSHAPTAKHESLDDLSSNTETKSENYGRVNTSGAIVDEKQFKKDKKAEEKQEAKEKKEATDKKSLLDRLKEQARKYQTDEAKKTGGFSLSIGRGSSSGSSTSSGHGTEISYQSPSAASLFGIGGMEEDGERLESGEFDAGVEGLGEPDVLGMDEMGESDVFGFQKYGDNQTQTAQDLFGFAQGGTPQTGEDLFGFVGTANRPQTSEDLFGAGIGLNTGVNQAPLTFKDTFGFSNPMGEEKPVVQQHEIRTNLASGQQNYRPNNHQRVKVVNPPSNIYNKNRNKRYYKPPQVQYTQRVPDSSYMPMQQQRQYEPQTQRGLYNRIGRILDNNADYASNFDGYAYNLDVGTMMNGDDGDNMVGFNPAVIFGSNDFSAPVESPAKRTTKKYRVTTITVPKKNVKAAKKTTPKKSTKKTSKKSKSTSKKTNSNSKGKVKYTKKNESKVADINKLIWG